MIGGKYCKDCKKRLTEVSFGAWKIAYCNCNIVIAHLTNKAIMKLDKPGDSHLEVRRLVREMRLGLNKSRMEFDKITKLFPPSQVKDERGDKAFYNVD